MVNTFLVCRDFAKSAALLDTRRLNKQCTEAKQIIDGIEQKKKGFSRHPASLQWINHLDALKYYYNVHREEALDRELKITTPAYTFSCPVEEIKMPWFVDCPHYWYSHCAALYLKMRWYYEEILTFPKIYLKYGYFWPSKVDIDSLCPLFVRRQLMYDAASKRVPVMDLGDFLQKYCGSGRIEARRCIAKYKSGPRKNLQCLNAVKGSSSNQKGSDKETNIYCGSHIPG